MASPKGYTAEQIILKLREAGGTPLAVGRAESTPKTAQTRPFVAPGAMTSSRITPRMESHVFSLIIYSEPYSLLYQQSGVY